MVSLLGYPHESIGKQRLFLIFLATKSMGTWICIKNGGYGQKIDGIHRIFNAKMQTYMEMV
jgi:hypothetical protein